MNKSHYIIPIFVPHEGCTHNCIFCNQSTITGSTNKVDSKFVQNTVESYLNTIPKNHSTIELSFFGGTFTAIPIEKQNELLKVALEYKKQNKIHFIRLSTRPNYIDENILKNLKNFQVDIIELGVQSLDSEVLKKSGRGHSEEDVIKASKLIQQFDFTLGHQIMLGLPEDTFNKDMETTEKIIKLKPSMVRIYPALVIKNTPMEKMYINNLYNPYSLDQALEISKNIYGRFTAEGIKVIRMGLQATEEINEGREIISGPFHPAFGEIVEGSILNDMIRFMLPLNYSNTIEIKINNRDLSKLYCRSKKYFEDMKKHINALDIKVIQDTTLNRGEIQLKGTTFCKKLSINDFILKKYSEGYLSNL